MFTVELYAKIRHAVMIDGLSRREAAKRFGVHRNTITKMLSFSVRPDTVGVNGRHPRSSGLIWRGSTPFLKATARFTRSSGTRRIGFSSGCGMSKGLLVAIRSCAGMWRRRCFGGGDVRAIEPSPRPRAGGFWRGGRVHWWQEGSVPLFLHGSAALGWLFRQGVSGRNSGSLLRWPCGGIRFLRRRAAIDSMTTPNWR